MIIEGDKCKENSGLHHLQVSEPVWKDWTGVHFKIIF